MASQFPSTADNAYDDETFITEEGSRREQPTDNTCRPDFPPMPDRGYNFQPFDVKYRDFGINQLP